MARPSADGAGGQEEEAGMGLETARAQMRAQLEATANLADFHWGDELSYPQPPGIAILASEADTNVVLDGSVVQYEIRIEAMFALDDADGFRYHRDPAVAASLASAIDRMDIAEGRWIPIGSEGGGIDDDEIDGWLMAVYGTLDLTRE